jgi:Flp pilus assembly pilin Flp
MRKVSLKRRKNQKGQTIVEYILIIALVVVASVGILSLFSDMVRDKISGVIKVFDPSRDTSSELEESRTILENLGEDGMDSAGN